MTAPGFGSVIRYAYLWADEAERGQPEGLKDRPALVIAVAVVDTDGRSTIMVLAVTHSPPVDPFDAVELPREVKRQLGLDASPSWVVTTEANAFRWPGPDIRNISDREPTTAIYGRIPAPLLSRIARSYLDNRKSGRGRIVHRTD